jgi:hypothetical protein
VSAAAALRQRPDHILASGGRWGGVAEVDARGETRDCNAAPEAPAILDPVPGPSPQRPSAAPLFGLVAMLQSQQKELRPVQRPRQSFAASAQQRQEAVCAPLEEIRNFRRAGPHGVAVIVARRRQP